MRKTLSFLALCLLILTGCKDDLISQEVRDDFQQRMATTSCDHAEKALQLAKDEPLRDALTFLYAYMTWPDAADYSPEFHVAQTEYALRARKEMPWGTSVPNREWLHFVLPTRVNNEALDSFRIVCYEELKERVKGLSMYDAVLEVNHWCHEHVTYKPSDARTSTPLQSMRTAYGRCGEESTYTVAALRTIGIPARQVYTPRWAHTDDNHAWVEAWVDGKWYFLGACEPEPVLNLGWFNQPASRGMLMHTKVFGKYDGPEDVMSRNSCYTEINVTANYADVNTCKVRVVDTLMQPVAQAELQFKLYNYAELYTVMATHTDNEGYAAITAGLGDLVAWASDGKNFGFKKFTVGKDQTIDVVLNRQEGEAFTEEMNITPPAGKNNLPKLDAEAVALNARRFVYEDSLRNAYVLSFPDSAKVLQFCKETQTDFNTIYPFIVKSRGNYAAVFDLFRKYPNLAAPVLGTLSEKDIRDFNLTILEDHLQYANNQRNASYLKYVLCPRIENEPLTPWRSYFNQAFTKAEQEAFFRQPERLAQWIKENVATDSVWNTTRLYLSPESAHRYAYADTHSKCVLFVAAARSCGIPARIDPVTGTTQYMLPNLSETGKAPAEKSKAKIKGLKTREDFHKVEWENVDFQEDTAIGKQPHVGALYLNFTPREYMENPKYFYHFTLSRLQNGFPNLQEYGEGDNWKDNFKTGMPIAPGNYLLTSGTRMANGSVLARFCGFTVPTGEKVNVPLVMREDKEEVAVIGNFNSENKYYDCKDKAFKSILSTTGRGYFVVGLIRANHEPTNHILHDIAKLHQDLEKWGRTLILLFPSQDEYDRFQKNCAEFKQLPSNLRFGIDTEGQVSKDLFSNGLTHSKELPIVIIGDTFNRVVFKTQGYTIGLGEQLKQTIGKL